MSDSSESPGLHNPNAPRIPYWVYLGEKASFAGVFLGAISYGIAIVLFFRCIGALFNPVNRNRRVVRWWLVGHTTVSFAFATIYSTLGMESQRIQCIDNREFPGVDGVLPPGPYGYALLTYSDVINIAPYILFLLTQWLADGFLLYRCYIIYSKSRWAIAIPCSMYLASMATSITLVYNAATSPDTDTNSPSDERIIFSYFMISLLLNVLLTLMIVTRLILHVRNMRNAMGTSVEASGLYKSIVSVLVESCALYATSFLVYIVTWSLKGSGQYASEAFQPILAEAQVIAPFLVILRVANRTTVTSDTVASGSLHFGSEGQQSTGDDRTLPDWTPTGSTQMGEEALGEIEVAVEDTITLGASSKI